MSDRKADRGEEGSVVWIRWLDAMAEADGQTMRDDLHLAGLIVETAGVLVHESDEMISVAQDRFDQGDVVSYRKVLNIPRPYIVEMQIW